MGFQNRGGEMRIYIPIIKRCYCCGKEKNDKKWLCVKCQERLG